MAARLILDCRNIVGESIVWSVAEQSLYWVDIVGSHIHSYAPASGQHHSWPTPELPTSIGLRKDGGFIVGLRRRVALWSPGGGFETFAVPEPDQPGNRLNEGVVGPDGAFWVGTMQENIAPDGSPQEMTEDRGALYRIAPDGSVKRLTGPVFGITNTMVWTLDGRFVTADTQKNQLYCYDHDVRGATISNRRGFGAGLARGLPDGSTRAADGTIYTARVAGGGCIAMLASHGELLANLDLPCSSPTSCRFGGSELTTLFVTSARFGMRSDELAANPIEGGLFAVDHDSTGVPPHRFG